MWKEQILSGIGEDPDKPKVFVKKNGRNYSYHEFHTVWAKIQINRGLLYVVEDREAFEKVKIFRYFTKTFSEN